MKRLEISKIPSLRTVSEEEHNLVLHAEKEYGREFAYVQEMALFYGKHITSVSVDHFIFLSFLSQFNKHLILSVLSAVRRHKAQSLLDLRLALEAGPQAAYSIVVTNPGEFVKRMPDGTLEEVPNKCYKWLEKKYPSHSKAIYSVKTKYINNLFSHSNFIATQANFKADDKRYNMLFWDDDEKIMVRQNLWMIGNMSLCILDLIFHEARLNAHIKIDNSFAADFKRLMDINNEIRDELRGHPKFSKWYKAS